MITQRICEDEKSPLTSKILVASSAGISEHRTTSAKIAYSLSSAIVRVSSTKEPRVSHCLSCAAASKSNEIIARYFFNQELGLVLSLRLS